MTINITAILNNKEKEWSEIGSEAEDATQGRSLRLNDVH